jgi:hypothetical protein
VYWIPLAATLLAIALLYVFRGGIRRAWGAAEARRAVREFARQREQVEAKFFDLARASGKPKGLRWIGCDWLDRPVTYARDTSTGQLAAFVPVNITFEAIAGEDMEEVEAVGLLRDAAAVFHYQHGAWSTGGRALFNMNPDEAVRRLHGQFEPVRVNVG